MATSFLRRPSSGNAVYVGSGDGRLYALDRVTGKSLWSFDAGAAIMSSPAVANGLVFFGTYDGRFFAVDAAKGTQRWRLSTGPTLAFPWGHESGDRYTSSPNVAGTTVVFGAGDGYVYSVDAATGRVRWRTRTDGRIRGTPAISDGAVFIGSFDGRVYALELSSGTLRWRYDTDGAALKSGDFGFDRRSIQSSPAVSNGVVFIGARDGFVYALGAADGKLRWRYNHEISWINSSPAIADGVVYDGSSDAHFVQALDAATGRELWRANVGTTVWSSPSVAGEQLFFGDGSGRVRIVERRTGKELATFMTSAGVFSSPVIAGDLLFVGSADGGVYALRLGNGSTVQRAVFLDSAYVRADAAGRSVELTTYLTRRGYSMVDPQSIVHFCATASPTNRRAWSCLRRITFRARSTPHPGDSPCSARISTPAVKSFGLASRPCSGPSTRQGNFPDWVNTNGTDPPTCWASRTLRRFSMHAACAPLKKGSAGDSRAPGDRRGALIRPASHEHWDSTTGDSRRRGSRATAGLTAPASFGLRATTSSRSISRRNTDQRAE
jgi:outer membrane protein assembly factor BamB